MDPPDSILNGQKAAVPSTSGMSAANAQATLEGAGFSVLKKNVYDPVKPAGAYIGASCDGLVGGTCYLLLLPGPEAAGPVRRAHGLVVIGRLAAAVGAFGVGCFGYGVLVERNAFTLRRFTAPVLPAGERPMRVLHISDMHLSTDRRNLVRWVDSLAGLRPDLVVTTGDNLSQPEALPMVFEAYERLFAYPGVFVFGSNDYFAPNPVNPLKYLGIGGDGHHAAHASCRTSSCAGRWWNGAGTTSRTYASSSRSTGGSSRCAARRTPTWTSTGTRSWPAPPIPPPCSRMGVTHAPYLRLLDAMTADGLDLIMAGHTHGGQVCVPFYGALTTNCDLDAARVKGLSSYTHEGRTSALHVSAGLGTSPHAPYRFACRPEATLLTLVPRTA